jgi:hypothetical protein
MTAHQHRFVSVVSQFKVSPIKRAAWLSCFVLMRVLVLFFFFELSGLTHAALDIVGAGEETAHSDCEDEEAGHECPPGCAGCHCWHAGTPTPALPIVHEWLAISAPRSHAGFTPLIAVAPRGADPDSVYRPPRSAAFPS